MATLRNASGVTIRLGEAVYIMGGDVYLANAKNARSFSGIALREIAGGETFDGDDTIAYPNSVTPYDDDEDMT